MFWSNALAIIWKVDAEFLVFTASEWRLFHGIVWRK
jgi:hypothetical protein